MLAKLELLLQQLRLQRINVTEVYVNILNLYEQLYSHVLKETKNPSYKKTLQEDARYNLDQLKHMTSVLQESESLKTIILNCSQTFFKPLSEQEFNENNNASVKKSRKCF
jgi:hypothetical protein